MFDNKFVYIYLLLFLHCKHCYGERRLVGGSIITLPKRYMVYMVQAKSSIQNYDAWICGGAIVNRWLILTSAACVEDVKNMYAIAGYEQYVKLSDLDSNRCTQAWRRKVVVSCVPVGIKRLNALQKITAYDLQYDKVEKWSYIDIAVVKVEKPFLFEDRDWKECSYSPATININYDPKYEAPGTDAMVLGWGHRSMWRSVDITSDYNQDKLNFASVSILDIEECKKVFKEPDLGNVIDQQMICTFHDGKLDESGKPMTMRKTYMDHSFANESGSNIGSYLDGTEKSELRRQNDQLVYRSNQSNQFLKYESYKKSRKELLEYFINGTRRKGFCQNDHGGPLVTWINGVEHVIGVASVFRIDQNSKCTGPYLYTSTVKNKVFIQCIVSDLIQTDNIRRSSTKSICDRSPKEKGFDILRRYIKWNEDDIYSPVQDLKVQIRPQIPISHYTR